MERKWTVTPWCATRKAGKSIIGVGIGAGTGIGVGCKWMVTPWCATHRAGKSIGAGAGIGLRYSCIMYV